MPSVNLIQPAEPRVQPMNKSQAPSGDPFAEMLESAANKRPAREEARAEQPTKRDQPTAPASRSKTRADALERGSQPTGEVNDTARGGSKAAEQTAKPETVAEDDAGAPDETMDTDTNGEKIDIAADAPNGPIVTNAETNTETPVVEQPATETADPKLAATVTSDTVAVAADGEPATVAQPAADVAKAAPPTAEAAPDIANAVEVSEEMPATAAPKAAAAAQTPANDDFAEAPKATPAAANNMRAAAPVADQAQAPLQVPTNQNPPSLPDATNAISDDADQQLAQLQAGSQQRQAKPQEIAVRATETNTPAPAPADSAAPKFQPNPTHAAPMPEPVRALSASFDSAILNTANTSDSKPVPLNASTIAVEIVSRMREGMRRFDIRLDPPELGRVDVRLEVDRHGNVSTKLTVDRPETLDLMQREARGLERALQQAGLKTDAGGLEFSLRQHADERFAQGQGNSGGGDLRAERATDSDEPVEVVAQSYYRAAAFARGGVDITV